MTDSLALFLQHSWGNADSNPTKDVESIQKDYLSAEKLIQAIEANSPIKESERLVIYLSNLRLVSKWALLADGDTDILWNQAERGKVLETVLNNINDLDSIKV